MSSDEDQTEGLGERLGRTLSAEEAARRLGVQLPTLYAYVSRGRLRSRRRPGSRRRRYLESEVEALRRQSRSGRSPTLAVGDALDWGMPVLETRLTEIGDHRFFYRGLDVLDLARRATVEEVAALLWTGDLERAKDLFEGAMERAPQISKPTRGWLHPSAFMTRALLELAHVDRSGATLGVPRPEVGARLVRGLFAATCALRRRRRLTLAEVLQQSWCKARPELEPLLRATLILCADHELNVSSFTARCIASSGASLYESVHGGLCALRGHRHGGHSDRAEALLREVEIGVERRAPSAASIRRRLEARLARGETFPGFGQPLYPDGDPRFAALVELAEQVAPRSPVVRAVRQVAEVGRELDGRAATVDLGLAMVSSMCGRGVGGAWTLFALGRSVGWVAHALEEAERGKLIRPRARYVGQREAAARDR